MISSTVKWEQNIPYRIVVRTKEMAHRCTFSMEGQMLKSNLG